MQQKRLKRLIGPRLSRFPRFKQTVSKLLYKYWRFQQKRRVGETLESLDVNKTLWVDPDQIKDACPGNTFKKYRDRGKVMGGNWDLQVQPFADFAIFRDFVAHFEHGRPWPDTEFYQSVVTGISQGKTRRGCRTKGEYDARCSRLDKLFADIQANGYKAQAEIAVRENNPYKGEDEVTVNIGRHGDFLFVLGRHRLAMAKILGLEKIPVKVTVRHEKWFQFRKELLAYAHSHNGRLYQPAFHPDLSDIPARHADEPFEIIRTHLPFSSGDLLDIGAHWGYFCHRFEELGFSCWAMEDSTANAYFLQKLKRASNRRFQVIQESIFDYQGKVDLDVVLALNLYHDVLRRKDWADSLGELLHRLQMKVMFFQGHRTDLDQMVGAYQNVDSEAFIDFLLQHSNLNESVYIGQTSERHPIYMLRAV